MKNLLLIQKCSPINDYISIFLSVYSDVHMVQVESISDAIRELTMGPIFDCIFIGNTLSIDCEVKDLTTELKEYLSTHTRCKIIGTNRGLATQSWAVYVPNLAPPFKILDAVRIGLNKPKEVLDQKYTKIPIYCFKYFPHAPCNIYLMIGSNPDEVTYVKCFNENDLIDKSDVEKYVQKNVKDFYVPSDRVNELSDLISATISMKVHAGNEQGSMEVVADALDYASHVLSSFGINSKSQALVQVMIMNIISSVSKMDGLKGVQFRRILDAKEALYHKHVSLTAMLANSLLEELGWDNDKNRSSISFAAFFHNFFINEEDELNCISHCSLEVVRTEDKKIKIHSHAKLAWDFVKDFKDAPYEAQRLILEHHGSHDGIGFPKEKRTSSLLSSLFMISSDFSLKFLLNYERKSGEDVQLLLKKALVTYGDGNKKILEALQNCISACMISD